MNNDWCQQEYYEYCVSILNDSDAMNSNFSEYHHDEQGFM